MSIFSFIQSGAGIILMSSLAACIAVMCVRWAIGHGYLKASQAFIDSTYPIVGLVYGVFLAFTIVITWGQFNEAETSTSTEVTHLSELWRDAEAFPKKVCDEIHKRLLAYGKEVVASDWDSMDKELKPSDAANDRYEDIWRVYYTFEPSSEREKAFYGESINQLNEFGRARRNRVLYADAEVVPMVKIFLISGGILIVAFSLLLSCPSLSIQLTVTSLIAALTGFSIFLVLSLQRPFTGDVSVSNKAFITINASFERRSKEQWSCNESEGSEITQN